MPTPNNVSILLGNGDGTFTAVVNYAVAMNPVSVAVGDFNSDGKSDLAVANFNSDRVSILLGNGDGTFADAVDYAAGGSPNSVAVADFNGDGKSDLAAANYGAGNVSILLNSTGAMTIRTPESVPVGATAVTASVPHHGGSSYSWTLTGGTITDGNGTSMIHYNAGSPGTRMTFTVVETNAGGGCASAAGTKRVMVDFLDVPPSHPFHSFVIKIARDGITAGCGGGNYCPDAAITRAQIAVFLLSAKHGTSYHPPPATGAIFADVPANSFAAAWIEELYAEGMTAGCATNPSRYCPSSSLTRAQMSVFLLVGEHGSSYTPPPASGTIFNDVPLGSFAAAWIERLYNEGITGGCSTNPPMFCPNDATTRGQMAVFLSATFALP